MRTSLPLRVLIIVLILLVIPLFISGFFEFRSSFKEALENAKTQMVEELHVKNIHLNEFSYARFAFLSDLAYLLNVEKILPNLPDQKTNEVLKKVAEKGDLWGIYLFKVTPDHQFIVVASDNPDYYIGRDYTPLFEYREALSKESDIFFLYAKPAPHESILVTYIVIKSEETKEPIALLVAIFPAEKRLTTTLSATSVPFRIDFALLTDKNVVFASSNPELKAQFFNPLTPEEKKEIEASRLFSTTSLAEKPIKSDPIPKEGFFNFSFMGHKYIAYAEQIPQLGDTLIAFTDISQAFKAPRRKFLLLYSSYILLFLVAGTLVTLLTLRMSKPFNQLSSVMTKVKKHDLKARYKKDPWGFEINSLGQIFNDMIETLLENIKKAQDEHLRRQMVEQELKIGREVQMQILPQVMPAYPSVELAQSYLPAKEVGGDFYDVFIYENTKDKRLILTVADTSGKGISACLYSLGVKSLLRGFGKENISLKRINTQLNATFYDEVGDTGMFVTLLMASYDYRTKQLNYISCGHSPALILKQDGTIEQLEGGGLALGLSKFSELDEKSTTLSKGDLLLLYTDGVIEAHNPQNELYGLDRLMDFIKTKKDVSAKTLLAELVKELKSFSKTHPQYDDITLLAMKVLD